MTAPNKEAIEAAALAALARANIPVDVQELLLRGNPMRDVAPGALWASLTAALPFLAPQPSQSDEETYDVRAQAERPPSESDNYIDAELWRDLCEKTDRTSPEDQPDMALINQAEFFDYLAAVRAEATLAEHLVGNKRVEAVYELIAAKDREIAALREALRAATILIKMAQGIIGAYLPPDGMSQPEALNMLIETFDGPDQRAAVTTTTLHPPPR